MSREQDKTEETPDGEILGRDILYEPDEADKVQAEEQERSPARCIELLKVSKKYPAETLAVDEVSLSVQQGEMLFLTGKSGAGKTTLLRLIARMETPSTGFIEVIGEDLARIPNHQLYRLRRKMGIIHQEFKLLPEFSVAQNISLAMEVIYTPVAKIEERIDTLLQQLGLEDKREVAVADLSRGEQQRVAIARAAANTPQIILADEPTGNLDRETTQLVVDLFHELHGQGVTLVIATHDPLLYMETSHRTIQLHKGKIIASH